MTKHPVLRAFLMSTVLAMTLASAASASTYDVAGTCGTWVASANPATTVSPYEMCPTLIVNNVVKDIRTPEGANATWTFTAPAGTQLVGAKLGGGLRSGDSWRASLVASTPGQLVQTLEQCASAGCYAPLKTYTLARHAQLVAKVYCAADSCPNGGSSPRAQVQIGSSTVTVDDPTAPSAVISGGSISPDGWHGGSGTIVMTGSDNTGIQSFGATVDGDARFGTDTPQPCDYSKPAPCSDRTNVSVPVNLAGLADGPHALAGTSKDAAGNTTASTPETINVDNTPPQAPADAKALGARWRSTNSFSVSWTNPVEQFAPIGGANYELCPADQPVDSPSCIKGSREGSNLQRLDDLQVPGLGDWKIHVWLYDAAGNSTEANGITVGGLGLLASRGAAGPNQLAPTQLTAGAPMRRHHRRLTREPFVKLGHATKIRGRLTAGSGHRRHALSGQTLIIYQRVSIQNAPSERVGTVKTNAHGRYSFKAGAGPGRHISVVYPGAADHAGRIASVAIRVQARLSLRRNHGSVVNGDSVSLRGRVRGGTIPPGGALLELQVYSRGKWRPFATPRTAPSGRYEYNYRFETVSGGAAKFRFRAVLRKQATYPFSGRSHAVGVTVHGG